MDPHTKPPRRGGPASRRSPRGVRSPYTTEACQECRRRRAKCKFIGRDDGRGTAPKSLVMLLQSRVELLERVLWFHSIDVDASIAKLQAGGANSSGRRTGTGSLAAEPPQESNEPDGALCSKEEFGLEDDGEASYFGSSSGRVELLKSNGYLATSMSPPSVRSRLNQFCQEIESTPAISEELKEHLITLYFEWEQPWCQLVDERLFRESMQSQGRYFSPLLLNCILAIASRYSNRHEVRSVQDDPNTAGQTFLEIAEVLLHFDLQSPSITTIQSLGILSMMYVATGSDSKGWLRHGMAARLALDMGFNLNHSSLHASHALPDAETNLRSQIYWALYCTDKLWASYTGRVCTMLDSQASVQLPLSFVDADETAQPRETLPVLHHALSTQCQILEKILMNLYAPKKLPLGIQRQTFFDSCLLDLKSWRYRLPPELQTKYPATTEIQTRPHVYILHMVYHTSIIMLAKPFLTTRQQPSTESQEKTGSHIDQTAQRAATLCMDAARGICLLGEQYRKTFGSFRQSPVTATHCTLSAVLFLIMSLNHCKRDEDHDDTQSKATTRLVNSCTMTLGELSNAWTPARQYWKAVVAIIKGRQPAQSSLEDSSSNPVVKPVSTGASTVVPDLNLDGIDGSIWDSALYGGDLMADFQDMGTWPAEGDYVFPGLDTEHLFRSPIFDLPAGFDLFTTGNPDADFTL
ncbi:fungal-specific transcription factor domain-containing protein [Aspergillus carlsbadensis]|nr:fungal-specific transcription factor domain-containing protein [Aspergillus carlsbadensis]